MVNPRPCVKQDCRLNLYTIPTQAGSWRMATAFHRWIQGARGHFGTVRHGCDEPF
jgi:hypothetical protein